MPQNPGNTKYPGVNWNKSGVAGLSRRKKVKAIGFGSKKVLLIHLVWRKCVQFVKQVKKLFLKLNNLVLIFKIVFLWKVKEMFKWRHLVKKTCIQVCMYEILSNTLWRKEEEEGEMKKRKLDSGKKSWRKLMGLWNDYLYMIGLRKIFFPLCTFMYFILFYISQVFKLK